MPKSSFLFCVFKPEDMGFRSYDDQIYISQPKLNETPGLNYRVVPLLATEELNRDSLNYIDHIAWLIPNSSKFHSVVYCLRIPPVTFTQGQEITISLTKAEDIVGCISFSPPRCNDGHNFCCINELAGEDLTKNLESGFLRHPITGSGRKEVKHPSFILPKKLTDRPELITAETIPPLASNRSVPVHNPVQNQNSFWTEHKPKILGLGTAATCASIGSTLALLLLTGVIPPLGMTLALAVFVVMATSEVAAAAAGLSVYALAS